MIEALVRYFEARGCAVGVIPGVLVISKGKVCYAWAISQIDLQYLRVPSQLFQQADDIIRLIEENKP